MQLERCGAAVLEIAFRKNWVVRDLDSRALGVTPRGHREMQVRFGDLIRGG